MTIILGSESLKDEIQSLQHGKILQGTTTALVASLSPPIHSAPVLQTHTAAYLLRKGKGPHVLNYSLYMLVCVHFV